jgi:NADPH-dependent 7-cyano-7-deazaguanine reductase QueF-like protein
VLGDIGSKTTYILVPSEYADSLRNDYEPDIDRILNKIALDSELLTLYETDKDLWDAYERSWQKENSRVKNLKVINHYRNKLLNLPSIR